MSLKPKYTDKQREVNKESLSKVHKLLKLEKAFKDGDDYNSVDWERLDKVFNS